MHHRMAPIRMALFRPRMSEMKPEIKAPSQLPPAIEAVMPPWTFAAGPVHVGELLNGGPSGPWLK